MTKQRAFAVDETKRTYYIVETPEGEEFDLDEDELKEVSEEMKAVLKTNHLHITLDGDWLKYKKFTLKGKDAIVDQDERFFNLANYRDKRLIEQVKKDLADGVLQYTEDEKESEWIEEKIVEDVEEQKN